MQLTTTLRKEVRARGALQGPAGSGKTMSALLLAYGLTGNWQKIAIIDTEQNSASLYSHLGPFNTVQLGSPFTTERYIDAIELCELSGMEVIIIDSISPEWIGELGIVHQYCLTQGSKSEKWLEVMPLHNVFINTILTSSAHIIATVRTSGNKVHQSKEYAHYFTTVVELNSLQEARTLKDRTGLFLNQLASKITEETGSKLLRWCKQGVPAVPWSLQRKINACTSVEQLNSIKGLDLEDIGIQQAFTKRRLELEGIAYWRSSQPNSGFNGKVISLSSPSGETTS